MPRRRHSRAQASARPSVAAAAARYARRALAPAVLALIVALLGPAARGARATHSWASSPVALDGLRVVRQAREDDCGPALVATLAAWSGRTVGLDAVSAQAALGPEGDGVSLAEFARLASLHGASGAWYASGATWPTMKPWVAPLKRPSVISATSLPRPWPTRAD